jgi:checkpoint serine/threonine-protein kinase
VYSGDCVDESSGCSELRAFKIQSPPCPWEFYILSELLTRLKENDVASEVQDMILPAHAIHVFNNSSVLMTSLFNEGSLLDMMNHYHANKKVVPNTIICTYTLDILRCVDAIHRAGIIHGDIKPDNLLIKDSENTMHSMSMKMTKSIVLIDFGRSIDMRILPGDSKFTVRSGTEMFECVEMQTKRPWTYQVL